MGAFSADELFYSRIEAPFSKQGKSGYQVVYKTPTVTQAEEKEVEARVRCFEAGDVDARYQYFFLASGRVALVMSQEIEHIDTTLVDRTGRRGAFIAHALIFATATLAEFGYDPFNIFEATANFTLDPQSMLDIKEQNVGQRLFEADTEAPLDYIDFGFDVGEWSQAEFTKLWLFAGDAPQLLQNKQSLHLLSSDSYMTYELLRLIFSHLIPEQRMQCTFNTYADGCIPLPGTYWAIGGSRKQNNPSYWQARLDERRVNYRGQSAVSTNPFSTIAEQVYHELRLAQGYEEPEE